MYGQDDNRNITVPSPTYQNPFRTPVQSETDGQEFTSDLSLEEKGFEVSSPSLPCVSVDNDIGPYNNEVLSQSLSFAQEFSRYPPLTNETPKEEYHGHTSSLNKVAILKQIYDTVTGVFRLKETEEKGKADESIDIFSTSEFSSDHIRHVDELDDYLGWGRFCDIMFLIFLMLGITLLFIVFPVLTFSGNDPFDPSNRVTNSKPLTDHLFGNLRYLRTSLIDKDTPVNAYEKIGANGKKYKLVFSDEFNDEGRSFYPGDDQYWEAVNLHYAATNDLEWYDPDAATTENGTLVITMGCTLKSQLKLSFRYASGGIFEVSASLAGTGKSAGFWPGLWTLGNLGRPGYLATTEGVWPYSYNECDSGITPNQSTPDGLSYLPGQKLSSCACPGEDHPSLGKGRGAPEIDALEGSNTKLHDDDPDEIGVACQSGQFAPFDLYYYPDYRFIAIHNESVTCMNTYTGGPFQEALSGVTVLNPEWYDRKGFQTYGFDYMPGTSDGYISWFIGKNKTWTMTGQAVKSNGNIGPRIISEEPMSIILNLAISKNWAYYYFHRLQFPAKLYIDYVRIYQDPEHTNMHVTCDPPGYPTTKYIAAHPKAYLNPNATSWEGAGYRWPKNSLMHDCGTSS
ncbi:glucosidase [Schizosaccharomyces japonicus yFS275]|uniref:Glucosidase n=1 Tax=Schizosaccharomyces japonicus (strain yFS275 / FY16936) TaxID=402676 RepID=B6K2H8_SCHJY|nr:glucosidase [Schizosaccharomyces japonicus yFS275]EEB07359.2 glucosidase [Schizosaccharomyces japonicus yFS275]